MSGVDDANHLQHIFESQQSLTTWHEIAVQKSIEMWRALREGDVNVLRSRAGWPADRSYVPDNLAEKISTTFADMLFGEDPLFKSAETVSRELKAARTAMSAANQRAAVEGVGQAADTPTGTGAGVVVNPANVPPPTIGNPGATSAIESEREAQGTEGGPTEQSQSDMPEDIWDTQSGEDQERLNNLVEANELPAELYASEVTCSSEGEVWWRIYKDLGQSDYPIIEWHSRSHVRPLWRGRKLIAAAFVSELHREEIEDQWVVWRYVEIHATGLVRNLLYKGTPAQLGIEQDLGSRPETKLLEPEWEHDLGLMCGRIYNKLGRDRRVGVSDYHNSVDLLMSLNETTTIGHENVRLTAKKRIAVPREAIGEDGKFDASEDVLIMDEPLDDQMGAKTGGGKFAVLEYSFDATALIEYKLDLIATILGQVGIVAEFASPGSSMRSGGGGGAAALSGTALRMRLIPTTLAAKGKARPWDAMLPRILMLAQQLDALPEERGGFGRPWNMAAEPPAVERGEPLPTDESEETQRHVSAVGGEIESRRSAISALHPNWDENQVQEELDQIEQELKIFGPPKTVGGGRNGSGGIAPGMNMQAGITDTAG